MIFTRKRFLVSLLFGLLCLFSVVLGGCTGPAPADPLPEEVIAANPSPDADLPNLITVLSEDPNLVLFINALSSAGVLSVLEGEGPYTVFAPTNDAFTQLGVATSQIEPATLQQVIAYHVVPGRLTTADVAANPSAATLQGEPVTLGQEGDVMTVNYATVTEAGIAAANGVIHVVNKVLLPSERDATQKSVWGTLVNDGRFTALVDLMGGSEAMYTLRFTDFADAFLAPTDEAFAALAPDVQQMLSSDEFADDALFDLLILAPDGWPRGTPLMTSDMIAMGEAQTRVVEPGGVSGFASGFFKLPVTTGANGLMVGEALVVEGDIVAANGVIHAIDMVLIPPTVAEHLP
jgi:uncharacterized surface protein with fasciclin (FAS1) repeats